MDVGLGVRGENHFTSLPRLLPNISLVAGSQGKAPTGNLTTSPALSVTKTTELLWSPAPISRQPLGSDERWKLGARGPAGTCSLPHLQVGGSWPREPRCRPARQSTGQRASLLSGQRALKFLLGVPLRSAYYLTSP